MSLRSCRNCSRWLYGGNPYASAQFSRMISTASSAASGRRKSSPRWIPRAPRSARRGPHDTGHEPIDVVLRRRHEELHDRVDRRDRQVVLGQEECERPSRLGVQPTLEQQREPLPARQQRSLHRSHRVPADRERLGIREHVPVRAEQRQIVGEEPEPGFASSDFRIVVVLPVSVRAVIRNALSPLDMHAAWTSAYPRSAKFQRRMGSTTFV